MTVTIQLKLAPNGEQIVSLCDTLTACNAAADWVSERGFENKILSQYALQTKYYKDVRAMFNIGAQATCLIFAKVADAYKLDIKAQRRSRPMGSIAFDVRNLKIHVAKQIVSV